ncbi:MAG: ATP-binding cassette domain-containing protein [Planctomycetes bacterium]|nr:ATP-binding cassette domain-containing protein [Planctomycetota bacterium]
MRERDDNSNGPSLALVGLGVASNGAELLGGIDLQLRSDEMVAVVGPSGCGKTTLLRTINALIEPSAGEVRLGGQLPGEVGYPRWRRRIAMLEQQPTLLDTSVEANLRRPFDYETADRDYPADEAAELLEELNVGRRRLDQAARSLSVGQRQRLCLIRALLIRPDVLLLDEPTSALDPESLDAVEKRVVHEVRQRGLAALVVTHDRGQIERLCDRHLDLEPHLVEGAADHMDGRDRGQGEA